MSGSELIVILGAALLLLGGNRMMDLLKQWMRISRDLRRNLEEIKREAGLDLDDIDRDIRNRLK